MKNFVGTAVAFSVLLALAGPAHTAEPTTPKPVVIKDKVTVTATIEAIDSTKRLVTLKGGKGELTTVHVDEDVVRFDQMKVGDKVTAEYYESVVYEIEVPGANTPTGEAAGAAPLAGSKPAGAAMSMTVDKVTIQAIDMDTPAVTVKTENGDVMSFRARSKKNLKGVKVGDTVIVTHTKALLISVAAPK